MRRAAECGAWALAFVAVFPAAVGAMQGAATEPVPFRSFTIAKPAAAAPPPVPDRKQDMAALAPPVSRLSGSIGAGLIAGADGALEARASGTFAGLRVNFRSLTTFGATPLLDQGFVNVTAPDGRWSVDAGDVFSPLAGPGRGARVSWSARHGRRPSLLVSTPNRYLVARPTLAIYRDSVAIRQIGHVEGELASNGSHLIAGRFVAGRVAIDAADRRRADPAARDRSAGLAVRVWRGVRLRGSSGWSSMDNERNTWTTAGIHLPLPWLDVHLERAFTADGPSRNTTSSVAASGTIGSARLFHRQQWGSFDSRTSDLLFTQESNQLQSMATYTLGARLSLVLQLASQWTPTGRTHTWEELLVGWQPTPRTRVQTAFAVTHVTAADRFRLHVAQEVSRRFALEVDYGRLAPYQATTTVDDRPRLRGMLLYRFSVATPAGRANVRGVVLDHAERPVAGAVVRLGPYAVTSDDEGRYRFSNVPAGQFDLKIDERELSANRVWDGRLLRVDTTRAAGDNIVLRVAPLATISGRVFVDHNRNGTPDVGEAVTGAVIYLDNERATTTDRDGVYGFYNLAAGSYVVRLDTSSIGRERRALTSTHVVELGHDRPAPGIDFALITETRPIFWSTAQ